MLRDSKRWLILENARQCQLRDDFSLQENLMIEKVGHECYFGFVQEKKSILLGMDTKSILSSRQFWNVANYDDFRIWDNEREQDFWEQFLNAARYRARLNK